MSAHPQRPTRPGAYALALIAIAFLFQLALAGRLTGFVLVDDAYIHLRYARNLVEEGAFVYNLGQPVFGLTSPLFGLSTALLHAVFGSGTPIALLVANAALWSLAAWQVAVRVPRGPRALVLPLFLFWPAFVDNRLLGMETPLFVLLLVLAMGHALDGRVRAGAWVYGWALITRPEALLLAPFLFFAALGGEPRRRPREILRELVQPAALTGLLLPGLAWGAFSVTHYGGLLPQSMVAKSGWSSEHYAGAFGLESSLLAFPRLTFLPFVDALPSALRWPCTAAVLACVIAVGWAVARGGSRAARAWFGFYATYMSFFLVGKGATEASWYAVPSSVALLLASEPLWPERVAARPFAWSAAVATGCALLSLGAVAERAPLLRRYVDGYGAAALALNAAQPTRQRVLIGEIGVYGYESRHEIIDVGALVSPEVLPLKNARLSFMELVRATEATHFVISARALGSNEYPSVGPVWRDARDRAWFRAHCRELFRHADKLTFAVLAADAQDARVATATKRR